MAESDMREVSDPLGPVTRAERKWLLVSSTSLVAMTWGGLVPSKIDAIGMTINTVNSRVLVWLACATTGYFLAAFVFYCRADLFAARRITIDTVDAVTEKLVSSGVGKNLGMTNDRFGEVMSEWWGIQLRRYVYPRHYFEFWSPVAAGIGSLAAAFTWLASGG